MNAALLSQALAYGQTRGGFGVIVLKESCRAELIGSTIPFRFSQTIFVSYINYSEKTYLPSIDNFLFL